MGWRQEYNVKVNSILIVPDTEGSRSEVCHHVEASAAPEDFLLDAYIYVPSGLLRFPKCLNYKKAGGPFYCISSFHSAFLTRDRVDFIPSQKSHYSNTC